MAKLSVYVPDDLWDAVRKTKPDESASHVVQAGLKNLLGSTDDLPSYLAEAIPRPHPALAEISGRMRDEARLVFCEGYEVGIEMAKVIPWDLLDRMSEYDFDLLQLEADPAAVKIGEVDEHGEKPDWVDRLNTLMDVHEVRWGLPQRYGTTHKLGVRRALRDVWEAVRRDLHDQSPFSLEEVGREV